jgi:stage IV sporulation protein FB
LFAAEPPPTNYDVHFSLAGIPIRIHPFFWLAAVILGARSTTENPNAGIDLLIWVFVVLVSILVHEMGHAFMMRFFGEAPRVVLYMMGGLAIADRGYGQYFGGASRRDSNGQIMISAAGPGAGFFLAGLTVIAILLVGGRISNDLTEIRELFQAEWKINSLIPFTDWYYALPSDTGREMAVLFSDLLWVNIFWGILNLLPVFPLDGGQIARELLTRQNPSSGTTTSLWLSFITATALAVFGLVYLQSVLMAVLFGSLAYSSYMALQQFGGGGFGGRPW